MPELAEVEITRRQLERWWKGERALNVVVHDDALLSEASVARLDMFEAPLLGVTRRGKHLVLRFGEEEEAIAGYAMLHLRMTGRVVMLDVEKTSSSRIAWELEAGRWLHFEDTRRLGQLSLHEEDPLTTHDTFLTMGPEPHELERGADLKARFGKRKRRVKDLLLDQEVIAGVGNIAISELFHQVGWPPEVRPHQVSEAELDALVEAMPPYFDALIASQDLDVPMSYVNQAGEEEVNPFLIYGREGEPCPRCATPLARVVFGGRSTYHCPACQPER